MATKKKKKLTRRALIISIVLVLLSVVASVVYVYGIDYYRKYYACPTVDIDYNRYPVVGIDISVHQAKIDWQIVYDSKISFAFIKATEGVTLVDKRFASNWKEAKDKNIVVGAYLFYKFNKDGKQQAQTFIRTVKLTDTDLPPVVDFELCYGNRFTKVSHTQVLNELYKCMRELEKHYKVKPIIYTNIDTYTKYIKGNFDEYPLWLCKLCNEPTNSNWTFWQYTHKGVVPGIKGNVDMNIFNGSYTDFVNFIYNARGKKVKKSQLNATRKNNPINRRQPQDTNRKAKR
jgi:lysozyme